VGPFWLIGSSERSRSCCIVIRTSRDGYMDFLEPLVVPRYTHVATWVSLCPHTRFLMTLARVWPGGEALLGQEPQCLSFSHYSPCMHVARQVNPRHTRANTHYFFCSLAYQKPSS